MSAEKVGLDSRFVTFTLAGEVCCLSLSCVKEVLPSQGITEVPRSDSFVLGVINVRGIILTVVDGVDYIVNKVGKYGPESKIIIFEDARSGKSVGLLVESVKEVVSIPRGQISSYAEKIGIGEPFVDGVYQDSDSVTIVLNHSSLFENSQI